MADKAHEKTDEKLEEMERRIALIYLLASKEIQEAADDFFLAIAEQDKAKTNLLSKGKITEKQYKSWRRKRLLLGKDFNRMKDRVAKRLFKVNQSAVDYINKNLPDIYTMNYNALADSLDGVEDYTFTLLDVEGVKKAVKRGERFLPYKKLDATKDIRWNTKKIASEVLQGVTNGESVEEIAGRIQNVQRSNKVNAIRTARTLVTGAENRGRLDSYEKAESDGAILQKEWISSNDERTRHAHYPHSFDHIVVDIDEPFYNEIGAIMYPGDPDADPSNVYNCRCSLGAVVHGFKKQ